MTGLVLFSATVLVAASVPAGTPATVTAHPSVIASADADADLLAATRRARNAGKLTEAETVARQGLSGSADPVWPLTLALVLADQRRTAEALAVLAAPRPAPLPPLPAWSPGCSAQAVCWPPTPAAHALPPSPIMMSLTAARTVPRTLSPPKAWWISSIG